MEKKQKPNGWAPLIILLSIIIALIIGSLIFILNATNRAHRLYEESQALIDYQEALEQAGLASQESKDRLAYIKGEIETYTAHERTPEEKQVEYDFYMEKLEPLLELGNPEQKEQLQIMALIDLINDLKIPGVQMDYPASVTSR